MVIFMSSCWTAETAKIIQAHQADFNYKNCQQVLKAYGGYKSYVKKLGGVFAKLIGKNANVKTAAQFQEVSQYVFGLMAIYGFNYNNNETRVLWGGEHPFYPSKNDGNCNWGEIDTICGYENKSKTTNCNYGIDALYYKAGIAPKAFDYSYRYKWLARNHKVIHKKEDLQIGDMIHFFHSPIDSMDPDKWAGWGHVNCVGEKHGNDIVLYDTGNRFIRTGNFKKPFTVDSKNRPTGEFDNYDGWIGIRVIELAGGNGDVKGDSELAVEVIAGKWGAGDERKKRLGNRYQKVQSRVDYFLGGTKHGRAAYLRAAASYVLKGYAGKEKDRELFFGKDYPEVQKEVNYVIQTAKDVMSGKYGSGDERKKALGIDYDLIQQQVNRMV